MFNKNRIEALSDGVFAIAMTLLVLDIKVPVDVPKGHLAEALTKDFHGWISFVITFFITSVFWVFQHRVFDLTEKITKHTLIPTFVFLGFISALPFSTSLWGHHITEPLALSIYFANQFFIAAALTTKLELARSQGYLRTGVDADLLRIRLYGLCFIMVAEGISAFLLPINWIWPVPLVAGVVGRAIRKRKRQRLNSGVTFVK